MYIQIYMSDTWDREIIKKHLYVYINEMDEKIKDSFLDIKNISYYILRSDEDLMFIFRTIMTNANLYGMYRNCNPKADDKQFTVCDHKSMKFVFAFGNHNHLSEHASSHLLNT